MTGSETRSLLQRFGVLLPLDLDLRSSVFDLPQIAGGQLDGGCADIFIVVNCTDEVDYIFS